LDCRTAKIKKVGRRVDASAKKSKAIPSIDDEECAPSVAAVNCPGFEIFRGNHPTQNRSERKRTAWNHWKTGKSKDSF
jgi:hypothetical protein